MPPLKLTGLTRAKTAHACCTCRHHCQNVNASGVKVECPSFFTAFFGPPHWRVPKRFDPAGVFLCERHAKIVFPGLSSTKPRKTVKRRATAKRARLAPSRRARVAPRACEGSVAFNSGGAADSDDGDASEGDHASDDASPSDDSDDGDAAEDAPEADDAAEDDPEADDAGELDGEHVADMDDSEAFAQTMKKAEKRVNKKKKFFKRLRGEVSGMTGASDPARWRIVKH
jgi:hypothetical protein